jgi:uncharacterized protein (DUF2147 family)
VQIIIKIFKRFFIASLLLLFCSLSAFAENYSPIGYWKTLDPMTQKPNGVVHIWKYAGTLVGKIVKVYGNPVCTECPGQMHNKVLKGTTVLWGFSQRGEIWTGGKILSVKHAKVFDADMATINNGQNLSIRVKTGLGSRTQTWSRISGSDKQ